jgi:hypothetical protein
MSLVYVETKYQVPRSGGSVISATRLKAKYRFCSDMIFLRFKGKCLNNG